MIQIKNRPILIFLIYPILVVFIYGCMSLPKKNAALLQYSAVGDSENVKRILDRGANINARDRYGDTPLHLAIKNKYLDTANLLINRGADINARGALDDTPLHLSVYQGQKTFSDLLRSKGAEGGLLNRYGLSPREMEGLQEIEQKVIEAATLLNNDGSWINIIKGRESYDNLKKLVSKYLINSLVLQVIKNQAMRLRILILAIKLGMQGSEEKLVSILMVYGDKPMAEDYLNCGSAILSEGGRKWAREHGYDVTTGTGSHRATWGRF